MSHDQNNSDDYLSHGEVPGWRKIFYIVFGLAVTYLLIILIFGSGGGAAH